MHNISPSAKNRYPYDLCEHTNSSKRASLAAFG